jgi:hypothetical protein
LVKALRSKNTISTEKTINRSIKTHKDNDINLKCYQMFKGTDLLAIEDMNYDKVLAIISEVGFYGIRKF